MDSKGTVADRMHRRTPGAGTRQDACRPPHLPCAVILAQASAARRSESGVPLFGGQRRLGGW